MNVGLEDLMKLLNFVFVISLTALTLTSPAAARERLLLAPSPEAIPWPSIALAMDKAGCSVPNGTQDSLIAPVTDNEYDIFFINFDSRMRIESTVSLRRAQGDTWLVLCRASLGALTTVTPILRR